MTRPQTIRAAADAAADRTTGPARFLQRAALRSARRPRSRLTSCGAEPRFNAGAEATGRSSAGALEAAWIVAADGFRACCGGRGAPRPLRPQGERQRAEPLARDALEGQLAALAVG